MEKKMNLISGASIVYFSLVPGTKQIFLLLGRESNKYKYWCGFGGGIEENETIEQCAARECIEETLGIFPNNCLTDKDKKEEDDSKEKRILLENELKEGNYTLKIETWTECPDGVCTDDPISKYPIQKLDSFGNRFCLGKMDVGSDKDDFVSPCFSLDTMEKKEPFKKVERKKHVTFLKQIPWNPNLCYLFCQYKTQLVQLKVASSKLVEQIIREKKEYPERKKEESLLLFTLPTLEYFFSPWAKKESLKKLYGAEEIIVDSILFVDDNETEWIGQLLCKNKNGEEKSITIGGKMPSEYPKFLRNLSDLWNCYRYLPRCVKSHPSVFLNEYGIPDVKSTHLEKDICQYWSIQRLSEVLMDGGIYKGHVFRSCFLPTLAIMVESFLSEMFIDYDLEKSTHLPYTEERISYQVIFKPKTFEPPLFSTFEYCNCESKEERSLSLSCGTFPSQPMDSEDLIDWNHRSSLFFTK